MRVADGVLRAAIGAGIAVPCQEGRAEVEGLEVTHSPRNSERYDRRLCAAPIVIWSFMPTTKEKLESAFAKVRSLPEERQEAALEALNEIAREPYQLSDEELAILRPALERARRGETLSEEESAAVLDKPWS